MIEENRMTAIEPKRFYF